MATKTKVQVPMHGRDGKVHRVTFTKSGTKEQLCAVTTIKVAGKTFQGRRGGRALCGGKLSTEASEARHVFARCAKRASGDHAELAECVKKNYRLKK